MSESYYIRVRRKINGPVPLEKLKELAGKGRLSRAHELSTDGRNWEPAGNFTEVFKRANPVNSEPPDSLRSADSEAAEIEKPSTQGGEEEIPNEDSGGNPETNPVTTELLVKEWFYTVDGNQLGPVTGKELSALIRHGALNKSSPVWKPGMSQWVAIGYLPDFVKLVAEVSPISNDRRGGPSRPKPIGEKSKATAVILAILVGGLGIHHFYLGNTLRGLFILVITVLTFGIGWIIALIEAIMMAFASEEYFHSKWCNLEWSFS